MAKAKKKAAKKAAPKKAKKKVKKKAVAKRAAIVEVRQPTQLTATHPGFWTPGRREKIKSLCAPQASKEDFEIFIHAAQQLGANPLMRQIYCIMRKDNNAGGKRMTIQISIDFQRLIAERSGKYLGQTSPQWWDEFHIQKKRQDVQQGDVVSDSTENLDDGYVWVGGWVEAWTKAYRPMAARVGVYKQGLDHPTYGVATWSEFAKTGNDAFMWNKFSPTMLAKCAESQALRKALPLELAGVYTHAEMPETSQVPDDEQAKLQEKAFDAEKVKLCRQIYIVGAQCENGTHDEVKKWLKKTYKFKDSSKEMAIADLREALKILEAKAKKEGTVRGEPKEVVADAEVIEEPPAA